MDNFNYAFDAVWRVLLAGLVLGAGLPALFAVGIRSYAWGDGNVTEDARGDTHPIGKVLAVICFAIVITGVVLGITVIVATGFGKELSFEHVYPTLQAKS
jgi:hypothetical protein